MGGRCDRIDGIRLVSAALVDAVIVPAWQIEVVDAVTHRVHCDAARHDLLSLQLSAKRSSCDRSSIAAPAHPVGVQQSTSARCARP